MLSKEIKFGEEHRALKRLIPANAVNYSGPKKKCGTGS